MIQPLQYFRIPLKIHFGSRANLFVTGQRQTNAALSTDKADSSSLPASKNLLLAAQKQLLELPFSCYYHLGALLLIHIK